MIDLHTHSLFSDGELLPSELVYRAKVKGYTAIAITDHGDASTFDFSIPRIKRVAEILSRCYGIKVLPGIELTYVPPKLLRETVKKCRKLGAKVVVIHGESPVEPVPEGTNRAGILSGADILAHPGHITESDAKLAAQKGVCLEITTRKGHNKTNRHVAALAKRFGAKLVLDTDTHTPENLLDKGKIRKVLAMSGLSLKDYNRMQDNSKRIIEKNKSPKS